VAQIVNAQLGPPNRRLRVGHAAHPRCNGYLGFAHGAWIADPANNVIGLIQYPDRSSR
jgi:hypothetical protein